MATGCLLINIAACIIVACVFLHFCPIMNHEYHQTYAMFISASLMFLSSEYRGHSGGQSEGTVAVAESLGLTRPSLAQSDCVFILMIAFTYFI